MNVRQADTMAMRTGGWKRPGFAGTAAAACAAAAAICALIRCADPYNPFADYDNAAIVVVSQDIRDGDTVEVFTAYSLTVKVAVKELLGSITVAAPGNRLWPAADTTIDSSRFGDEPFGFTFSFFDTGSQTIVLSAARTDGKEVADTIRLFARSPLGQDSVAAFLGDSVVLRTRPVGDADINYYWSFGTSVSYSSQRCSVLVIPATPLLSGMGALWVSDGFRSSPADSFHFALRDTVKPRILCVNENYVGRDTIYTSDSVFIFKAQITDQAGQWVDSASVNGESFDTRSNRVYAKWLDRMYLNGPGNPLELVVYADDHFHGGNEAEKTFWVVYNDTVPRTVAAEIVVVSPPLDTTVTGAASYTVFGTIANRTLDSVDLTLSLSVNGIADPTTLRLRGSATSWQWAAALDSGMNRIELSAVDNLTSGAVDFVERTIWYLPGLPDTLAPRITQVTVDGAAGRTVYTDRSRVVVAAQVVDDGGRVDTVTVNGEACGTVTAAPRWYFDTLDIVHVLSGNEMVVRAVDSAGNDSAVTVVIYRNRRPVVEEGPSPALVETGSQYLDTLGTYDPDGDSVFMEKVAGPAALTVSFDGIISWTPDSSDTGTHQVVVRVTDGYQPVYETFTLFAYVHGTLPPGPVQFATSDASFPAFLEAGRDTLRVTLRVASGTGIAPFTYTARLPASGVTLLGPSRDSVLVWLPDSADTGWAQLVVTVRDQFPNGDTLYPRILVVPANRACAVTVRFSADTLPNGAINLNSKQGPDTLAYRIRDPDRPETELFDITIVQSRTQLVNHIDSARVDSFSLVIDPEVFDNYDTITVIAVDRGGNADTLKRVLYYGVPPFTPQTPSPPNAGSVADTFTTLSWVGGDFDDDSLWYDVYLGTNSQNLQSAGTTSATSFPVSGLSPFRTYYWQVVAHDWKSFTSGPVWEFNTP